MLTVSDGVIAGTREDRSGAALAQRLEAAGYDVVEHRAVADGTDSVAAALRDLADGFAGLVVTSGGLLGPREPHSGGHRRRPTERLAPGASEQRRRDRRAKGTSCRGAQPERLGAPA